MLIYFVAIQIHLYLKLEVSIINHVTCYNLLLLYYIQYILITINTFSSFSLSIEENIIFLVIHVIKISLANIFNTLLTLLLLIYGNIILSNEQNAICNGSL